MASDVRSPWRVGILLPSHVAPNMEAVLHNFGRMMETKGTLHLIQVGDDVPDRLRRHYDIYQYRNFRPDPIRLFSTLRACYRYASQMRPDVLMNVAQPQTLGLIVATVGRRLGIPSVVRMTGETFRQGELARTRRERLKVLLLHDVMAWLAYRHTTHIAAVGSHLRESLIAHGYSPGKISKLPQPFDPAPFQPVNSAQQRALKLDLGLRTDAHTVLYVGRLSWLKGADRLLELINRVCRGGVACQFCVIGQGPYETELRHHPDALVHCPGQVGHEQIGRYYQAADLLVFPSRTEGLPNVILEALAAELPIIASPVGEIPDYVSRTATQPSEFVEWLRTSDWTPDPWPEWFDWETQRAQYVQLFENIIADSGRS